MHFTKKISVMLAAALTAGTLAACGSGSTIGDYATTEVAKYGSESIKLAEANFWLRYEQMLNEAYYGAMYKYFGYDNMWTMEAGEGTTQADAMHTQVMQQILQARVLNEHMAEYNIELTEEQKQKIADHVSEFLETYTNFSDYCDADAETIQGWMETNSTAAMVAQAVKDAAEIDIKDEDIQAYKVEYITFAPPAEETEAETAAEGETAAAEETEAAAETEAAEEPAASPEKQANEALEHAKAGEELSAVAEEFGLTSSEASFKVTGETSTDVKYVATVGMKAGDMNVVQDGDNWILVKKVNDLDEEATEQNRKTETTNQQTAAFNAKYEEWAKSAAKFKVNEKIWSQITIEDMIYVQPTAEETEAAAAEETVEVLGEEAEDLETIAEEVSEEAEEIAEEEAAEETAAEEAAETTAAE